MGIYVGLSENSPIEDQIGHLSESKHNETTISITVVGASGDLARKKIFPALFALFYENWLPEV